MKAHSQVGEVGIRIGQKEYLLRPDFKSMSLLGTPFELASLYKFLIHAYAGKITNQGYFKKFPFCLHEPCFKVIRACLVSGEPTEITGTIRNGKLYKNKIPFEDMVVLAFHLLKWGIYGSPRKNLRPSSNKEIESVDIAEYVGSAVSHLGLSLSDAWTMTMTEFQRAWESKFPELKNKEPEMTKEEAKAVMERALKVMVKVDKKPTRTNF